MMQHLSKFAVILFVFGLQACSNPVYDLPYKVQEDAPPMWKLGWEHGCKTGLSAYGNDVYKTFYNYTQDVDKMKDNYYGKAWTDSFNFCRAYVNRYLAGESFTKEPTPTLFSTRNMNVKSMGQRRNDRTATGTGYFSPIQENKSFFELYENQFYAPGFGSTEWGSSAPIGSSQCDYIGRCGDDRPKWYSF